MVNFIRKKLQVFVSSTFNDLIPERQAAVEAILSAGHIPAGMELFAAGDESQMEVIRQWIDESDVHLLILGGRYGSIEPKTGKSYTHLEYEYAIQKKKPLFACVIKENAVDDRVKLYGKCVIEIDNAHQLSQFRTEVLTRMVKLWSDSKDIKIAVSDTLHTFAQQKDLIGWIRPTYEANMPALADEIARLSKENSELRVQVQSAEEILVGGLTYSQVKTILVRPDMKNFIQDNRQGFLSGMPPSELVAELAFIEIVELGEYSSLYFITDVGRKILARFLIDESSIVVTSGLV